MDKNLEKTYIDILKEDLVPALGCTEPIAISYASAKAREVLGEMPDSIEITCSGNIIKNVKAVIVPTTGNLKGIKVACILGAIAGDSSLKMEVLRNVKPKDVEEVKKLMNTDYCKIIPATSKANLYILVKMYKGNNSSEVEIVHSHTNIVLVKKNNDIIFQKDYDENNFNKDYEDKKLLNIKDIYNFANTFNIDDLKELFDLQISCNNAIAEEGLKNNYGACVGKTYLETNDKNDVKTLAIAYAAAGSDARMNGCNMAVVTNSGSGNQGMAILNPIYQYAKYLKVSKEKLYRALALANLIAIHQKFNIGKLSAFCGAVSAGSAAGAGIAYLYGATYEEICDTISNALATTSGIICDGAKSSCASKIAASVNCAILAFNMAMKKRKFLDGEGIVKSNVERTIDTVCTVAREGMKETDSVILREMLKK